MSNWDHANEPDLDAARDAYTLDDPKHPDYGGTMDAIEHVTALAKAGQPEYDDIVLFTGNPKERMRQMQETAAILAEPVRQRHTVTIGREHVRVEGWTMLGALLGVHPYLVWTRPTPSAERLGSQSRSPHHRRPHCRQRRSQMHSTPKPTGATETTTHSAAWPKPAPPSKALRQPLGFVITLAGFDPTPAEEMPHPQGSPFRAPTKRARDASGEAEDITDYLSQNQQKKIYALRTKLTKAGVFTEAEFGEAVGKEYEAEISGLTRKDASHLIERFEKVERDLPETH